MSRGEAIFKEASTVRDQLGFLAKVKVELQELFDFLHEFNSRLVIVIIVDDLDRCLTDGRNVKVLEAMQLILSVPGAPIISFLAVDSRIVVASIEEHYEKVFTKTNISGHEYLDKIVQLPFAMPEPPPEKVERLLSKALEGDAASPVQVAKRLKSFGKFSRNILGRQAGSTLVTFELTPTRDDPFGAVVDLETLVNEIDKFKGDDAEDTLELVCAAARKLGPYLTTLADRFIQPLGPDERVMHGFEEEAVEVLCRATNTALELGKLGFGEVTEFSVYSSLQTAKAVEKAGANVVVEKAAAEKAAKKAAAEKAAAAEKFAATEKAAAEKAAAEKAAAAEKVVAAEKAAAEVVAAEKSKAVLEAAAAGAVVVEVTATEAAAAAAAEVVTRAPLVKPMSKRDHNLPRLICAPSSPVARTPTLASMAAIVQRPAVASVAAHAAAQRRTARGVCS